MRKSRKLLFLASFAFIFLFGFVAVNAAGPQLIDHKAYQNSVERKLPEQTKENTTNEGIVRLTSMGGATSLAFRTRGKWHNGSQWLNTSYGPPTNVTTTGTNNIVYYSQSMSATMKLSLYFRNNVKNSTEPLVQGIWTFDRP